MHSNSRRSAVFHSGGIEDNTQDSGIETNSADSISLINTDDEIQTEETTEENTFDDEEI